MSATIFLIRGTVASGKSSALLSRFRERAADGIGAALWLAPTERARDAVLPKLLGPRDVCLAPNLFTFPDFARQVVRAAEPTARPLPELHQRLLLDHVLTDLFRAGELRNFAAVADHRGFADAVFGFLTELKGQGVRPEDFARAAAQAAGEVAPARDGGSIRDKDRQVALIYSRYQEQLQDKRLLDREATYARAREHWSAGRLGPFAAVRAAFVDGFTGFTPPQLDLLEAVVSTVEEVWISLLADRSADEARGELFSRPLATFARIQQLPADKVFLVRTDMEPTGPPPRPAGLAHLERALFRTESSDSPAGDAAGLSLVAAPGLLGEVRLAARAIKMLLLDGVNAAEILVTARNLTAHGDLVREVFAEYGIPIDLEGTEPLTRNPAVATLLRALRLADDGFPFAGTTALLRSGYFRPDWPEFAADNEVAGCAEAFLRLLGEPRGREVYLRGARLWAAEPQPGLEDEQPEESRRRRTHRLAQRSLAFLERFFRAWDHMPHQAEWAKHANWLRRFADDLGLAREAERTDSAAWRRFWSELDAWAAQEGAFHQRAPTYTRATFARTLALMAASVGVTRTPRGPGRVRVVPADQARHLDCECLFLLGLGERSFPDLGGNEALYDDAERQVFRQFGVDLSCAADRLFDEMLLFYQLVTRPRRRLVLSYSAVDGKGQELLPSSFLTAAVECFRPGAVPVERQNMLIQGFDRQRPLSPAEYRVRWALAGGALHGLGGDRAVSRESSDLYAHLRAAADVVRQRFRSRDFSPYDGLLGHAGILADLGERFGPDNVFSPTALESYVACPFRFFMEHVLKLEPLEDPSEEVEQTRRGAAVHRALARLHQRLKTDEVQAPAADLVDRYAEELRTAVGEYAARTSSPAAQTLWRLEGQRLERAAARYGPHWEKLLSPWGEHSVVPRPHLFEAEFGPGTEAQAAPLVIRVEDVEVRIRGRIDRIDVAELPDGSLGFWVIDYKTGRSAYYGGADLVAMSRLQLTLYALAAERVLLADARPLGLAYWMVTDSGPKVALPAGRSATAWLTATEHWPKFRSQLEAWVVKLVGHIRRGAFPLKPRSEHCTDTCPYGQVCRIAQSRAVEKDWELPLPTQDDGTVGEGLDV